MCVSQDQAEQLVSGAGGLEGWEKTLSCLGLFLAAVDHFLVLIEFVSVLLLFVVWDLSSLTRDLSTTPSALEGGA